MELTGIALQGLQQAFAQAETAARHVSQAASPTGAAGGDIVDLSAEMLALMQAKNLTGAMVSLAQTGEEMDSHIVNLFA